MQRQAAFDLDRRDVLAAGDDHVIDPPRDEQVALGIEIPGVPGEIPAVAQRLRVCLGPAPVALEGFIPGKERDDLALFAWPGNIVD